MVQGKGLVDGKGEVQVGLEEMVGGDGGEDAAVDVDVLVESDGASTNSKVESDEENPMGFAKAA